MGFIIWVGVSRKTWTPKGKRMKKLKESVSTRTKVKVIRAIESGIRMQSVAETMGLSPDKVKEIRKRANADIKAVSAFLQDALLDQKRRMAHVVRSSGGNELSSRRESLGVFRQTLRRWTLAAETGSWSNTEAYRRWSTG